MFEENGAAHVAQTTAQVASHKGFDIDEWVSGILNSSSQTVQAILFFGFFYLFGSLCRRYIRYVIFGLIFATISVKWLEYQNIMMVDWPSFFAMIGLDPTFEANTFFVALFEWIRQNFINCVAGLIGFLLGYRPGSQKAIAIRFSK